MGCPINCNTINQLDVVVPASRVTIDTMQQLSDNEHIGCGGWGEQTRDFFLTSLDSAGQKIGQKMQAVYDEDEAVEKVTHGGYAYYENVHFLRHAISRQESHTDKMAADNRSVPQGNRFTRCL